MSCPVCEGYSSTNCPYCSDDVEMVRCPDCLGEGVIYLAFDLILRKEYRVSKQEYIALPEDEDAAIAEAKSKCRSDIITCITCRGEGEIPEDY